MKVVDAARSMLKTPFRHQGRVPGLALDCAGLVVCAATQAGYLPNDYQGYGRTPANGLLESAVESQSFLQRIIGEPIAGDILLMRFAGDPQHLAICAGETIIHAWEAVGMVCEHRLDDKWRRRIVGIYRFIEVGHE